MVQGDLVEVVQAECQRPAWTAAQFAEELAHSFAWQLVARLHDSLQFAGYLCWRTVVDEAEIVKLAVVPVLRRQGIGQLLLSAALRRMADQGAATCFLEVRASNIAAIRLYQKNGFVPNGLRKKYYVSPCEDALLLKCQI